MTIIKNLSINIVKKGLGFSRREDLDERDYNGLFRGFEYKGLPITTQRHHDKTYLTILESELHFTGKVGYAREEFRQSEEYKLEDKFWGVDEIDLEELIDACERILAKVEELNQKAEAETLDLTDVCRRAAEEIKMIDEALETAKRIEWWTLCKYDLEALREKIRRLISQREWLKNFDPDTLDTENRRHYALQLKERNYVMIKNDDWQIQTINRLAK